MPGQRPLKSRGAEAKAKEVVVAAVSVEAVGLAVETTVATSGGCPLRPTISVGKEASLARTAISSRERISADGILHTTRHFISLSWGMTLLS